MPACKNVKNKTFTGRENTPLGRGYHASGEKVNSIMKGKDGKKYKVVKTKSGKRWQKVNGRMKSPGRSARGAGMSSMSMEDDPRNDADFVNLEDREIIQSEILSERKFIRDLEDQINNILSQHGRDNKKEVIESLKNEIKKTEKKIKELEDKINSK